MFEILGSEFFNRQTAACCLTEFMKSVQDSLFGDFDSVDNFSDDTAEVVHSRCKYQGGTTDPGRSSTISHPVATHPLHDSDRFVGNTLLHTAKIHLFGETKDKTFNVDRLKRLECTAVDMKHIEQIFEDGTKLEYVDLDKRQR